jgi:hypothetical protein
MKKDRFRTLGSLRIRDSIGREIFDLLLSYIIWSSFGQSTERRGLLNRTVDLSEATLGNVFALSQVSD